MPIASGLHFDLHGPESVRVGDLGAPSSGDAQAGLVAHPGQSHQQGDEQQARGHLDAQHLLIEACERFAELGRQHDFELLVLVHPLPDMLSKAETLYFRMFYDELAARGIEAHDLTTLLQQELEGVALADFAWPVDRHFNARGYAAFARAVQRGMDEQGWGD